jgi:hypothetical protein
VGHRPRLLAAQMAEKRLVFPLEPALSLGELRFAPLSPRGRGVGGEGWKACGEFCPPLLNPSPSRGEELRCCWRSMQAVRLSA